jgi:hypothetical protein
VPHHRRHRLQASGVSPRGDADQHLLDHAPIQRIDIGHRLERRQRKSRGTSKSAVSRRFVAKTAAQLTAWQTASFETLDLVGVLIDGVHIGEHCLVVALGIAADGQKHALGLWDGSTENARLCQDLLASLQSRGLRTDRSLSSLQRRVVKSRSRHPSRAEFQQRQGHPHEQLAETLAAHVHTEEAILYPAAILVGDIIRARIARK